MTSHAAESTAQPHALCNQKKTDEKTEKNIWTEKTKQKDGQKKGEKNKRREG